MKYLLTAIFFLSFIGIANAGGWYYTINNGTMAKNVGPYNSEYGCKDWLGSALYMHGPLCHDHPTDVNCAATGPGYAAPGVAGGTCSQCNGACHLPEGRYGFLYPDANTVNIVGCQKWRAFTGKKGSRCFFVGNTNE